MQSNIFVPFIPNNVLSAWQEVFYTNLDIQWIMGITGMKYIPENHDPLFSLEWRDNYFCILLKTPAIYFGLRFNKYHVHYSNIYLEPEYRNQGIGTRIIRESLDTCKMFGLRRATTLASGTRTSNQNGYYSWAIWGFDGILDQAVAERIPNAIRFQMKKNSLQELIKTPEGKEWWKENGRSMYLTYLMD